MGFFPLKGWAVEPVNTEEVSCYTRRSCYALQCVEQKRGLGLLRLAGREKVGSVARDAPSNDSEAIYGG